MDPVGLTNSWLQAVHRIQSGDDPLPKKSHGERTMTEIIERALRHGLDPDPEPSSPSAHRVDRTA
jgi:hypothetical protein